MNENLLRVLEDRRPARSHSEMGRPGIQAEVLRVWKLDKARELAQSAPTS